jgi:hypothetical protein
MLCRNFDIDKDCNKDNDEVITRSPFDPGNPGIPGYPGGPYKHKNSI